jgi:hypothetical protein
MSDEITTTERARLAELESVIESNVALVGKALFEIRESRLYRQTHKTFEDYCRERFAMNRDYINKQIRAADVINNLDTNCIQTKPTNEAQTRPLSKLPPADQPKAWEKANEIAKEEGRPVAARHVEQAVAETIEAVVVDGTKPDAEPDEAPKPRPQAKSSRLPAYMPNDADELWLQAKLRLDNIHKTDRGRVRILNEIIAYCQERLSCNK